MSEIVERLKKNEKAFAFLTQEERDCLAEASKSQKIRHLYGDGCWSECFSHNFANVSLIYRISPDYQEEPGIEKCEVEPLKCLDGKLGYGRENYTFELTDALNDPDFIGFEYASGGTSSASRLTEFDKDCMRKGVPADRPKYVLFKRSK